ncbi:MAG: YhdP family phospholipid transporter [Acidiferrobacter sp.]
MSWWKKRSRGVRYGLVLATALLGIVMAVLLTSPLWLTPILRGDKPFLEKAATSAVGAPVHIAGLVARVGWRPGFVARQVVVMGLSQPAVVISAVRVQLSWIALLRGRLRPAFVGVYGAKLALRKTATGFHVIGLPHRKRKPFPWRSFLRKEHALKITDSHMDVVLSAHRTLSLRHLNASWEQGFHGPTLQAAAAIPTVCGHCAVTVEFDGGSFRPREFRGAVGVSVRGLHLHAAAILTKIPAIHSLAGFVGGRLWTSWVGGHLEFMGGNAHLVDVLLPATAHSRVLMIPQLSGRFSFKRNSQGFRFYAADMQTLLGGVAAHPGAIYISHRGSQWRVQAQSVHLAQIAYVARRIHPLAPALLHLISQAPHGHLMHLRLRLRSGPHWHYHVNVRFLGVGLGRSDSGLLFSHASGTLVATTTGGQLHLTGLAGLVRGPKVLPGPLLVQAAQARILWQMADNGFSFDVPALHLVSTDGTVDGVISSVHIHGQSPRVAIAVALHNVNAGALGGFYPRTLHPHLRHWLTRTIRGGLIKSGHVTLNGPLDRFPFRHGGGVFRAKLHVIHGRYRFLPRWPEARDLRVTVATQGVRLSVKGSGRLGGMRVPALSVHAGPLGTRAGVASVRIQGAGDLGGLLAIVLPHVRPRLRRFVPQTLSGAGPAKLKLMLHIPFARKKPLTLQGTVGFAGTLLRYPWAGGVLHFRGLKGTVGFTGEGPDVGRVTGAVLGGPFALTLKDRRSRGVVAQGQGLTSAGGWRRIAGPAAPYMDGPVSWRLRVLNGHRFRAAVRVNLRHVAIHLPYPAGKALGVAAVAHAHLLADQHGTFISANIPRHLRLSYRAPTGRPSAIWVGVGSALSPRILYPGFAVGVRSAYLDASAWAHFVTGLTHAQGDASSLSQKGFQTLRALHLYVGSLVLAGRPMGTLRAHFQREGTAWRGALQGPNVLGTIDWQPRGRASLVLNFQRLVIPRAVRRHSSPGIPTLGDPRDLPAIQFIANRLIINGRHLGHVAVDGAPFPGGFRMGRITLARHQTTVSGQGQWTLHDGLQESMFALVLHSRNLGGTLTDWGLPHQVAGGRATAHMALNWPGGPTHFALDRLEGSLRFFVRHGRFVQVRQGAGKLLGIFNVDSIARYLTLDFSNIFGRGFSFNRIDGKLLVERGVAITSGIHVHGASANVLISGQAALAAQTFHLKIQVNPHLQNNVTLATGLLGGPIAGAAVLLMQKVFASEIDQGTRLTYFIKGPWSKPIVQKKTDKN